jgi:AIPR protein
VKQEDVLKQIRSAVRALQESGYYSNSGDAFCHWAMATYFELDEDDALEACNVSGPGDKGLDAFWHDEPQRLIVAAQAKYASRPRTFDQQAVLQLESAYGWLRRLAGGERTRAREELRAAAQRLARLREAAPDYPIDLYCFAAGTFSDGATAQAEAFNAEHLGENVRVVLVGLDELTARVTELKSRTDAPPDTTIKIDLERYFDFAPPGEPKTVVASVNVHALAKIEREHRYRIFQRNVRYWLRATNRINRGIERTVSTPSGRARFWYYNNGIAIVCDAIEVVPNSARDGGHAEIKNLQIVNGCQTTTTLGETIEQLDDPASPAFVLVRIFEAADEQLQSDISLYNNRQNAVKDRDLLSNDDPQARLEVEFQELDPPWFYERKRGQWDAEVRPNAALRRKFGNGARRLDNEVAAQAAYAFWYDPGAARARKRMLFVRTSDDENGLYDDLFNDSTTPHWLLLPFRLGQYVAARKRAFVSDLKAATQAQRPNADQRRTIQRAWLKFADQFLIGTTRVYLDQEVDLSKHAVQEELLQGGVFEPMVERAYSLALRDLTPFFRTKHQEAQEREEPFDPANYVKGNWREVAAHLEDQSEYRSDIGEAPFEGLPLPR